MNYKLSIKRILRIGTLLSVTTSAATLYFSRRDSGKPWAAVNHISHIVDGDNREFPEEFAPRESLIGLSINAVAMYSWVVVYEVLFGKTTKKSAPLTALATTVLAYIVDYHVVPPQFTPGIEKKITKDSIYSTYAILALTFLAGLWTEPDTKK